MIDDSTRRIFREMLREEWRLHCHLFSGLRFALFPLLVAVLVAGASELLVRTGTSPLYVFAGLHALALVFGLHTGSIGFVGRDALRNLLGDLTLLVFAARTLPLGGRRLLGVFVVKDVVYYAFLFTLPMAIGTAPLIGAVPEPSPLEGVAVTVALLWTTLTGTFVLGIGVTIAGIGLSRRPLPGVAALSLLVAGTGGAWLAGVDPLAATPYGVFLEPTIPRIVASLAAIVAIYLLGAVTFDVTASRHDRRVGPRFRPWLARVGEPIATKTALDVHRSSGGFGKVVISATILFGVTVALVDLAGRVTGVVPSTGISFGAILGLTGFTTYNWLTQFDDVDSYLVYPIDVADVIRAKFRAFLTFGPLVAMAFYVIALGWHGGRPLESIVGAVVLVGVATYIFGVTVYLAGLSPNEFLFDTGLFVAFGAAMVVPLVPILVVGFAFAPVPGPALVAIGGGGIGLAGVGVAVYRRALPKWSRYHRR